VVAGAVAVALGTLLVGWLAPAIWGACAGVLWRRRRPAPAALVAAVVGWGILLVIPWARGAPVALVAARLGTSMQLPAGVIVAATLALPAVLAASAAQFTAGLLSDAPRHTRA
jgi:hypothetical protein